jgi:murein L,D-transpeptidase YcbB/YkuD
MPRHINLKSKFSKFCIISTVMLTAIFGSSGYVLAQFEQAVARDDQSVFSRLWRPVTISGVLAKGAQHYPGLSDYKEMAAFYADRGNATLWTDFQGLNQDAIALIHTLKQSWTHGLNPEKYHLKQIETLSQSYGFNVQAELEVYLTSAFLKYAQDLSGMRVDAASIGLDSEHWKQKGSAHEFMALLNSGRTFEDIRQTVEPQGHSYKTLQAELQNMAASPEPDFSHILPIKLGAVLRPGQSHDAVASMRTRMGLPQPEQAKSLYDDALAAAIMKFQRDHGLKDDGVIGPRTVEALNETRQDKMLKIVANLERLRWISQDAADRYVVVNIPAATLWAIEQGKIALEMPVIVGNPKRPTQVFVSEIRGVRLNPTWTVPPTIKRQDMWPRVIEDPEYLIRTQIEIFDGDDHNAPSLDPLSVDWANLTPAELNRIRMVQTPGPHNPLGEYRVLMDNKHNIYLHDTNEKDRFNASDLQISSGCIRLKDPKQLAEFIMRGNARWDRLNIDGVLASRKTIDVVSNDPMPVYLLYHTVWVDDSGKVVFGEDIYHKDQALIEKLKDIDGFIFPAHNMNVALSNSI